MGRPTFIQINFTATHKSTCSESAFWDGVLWYGTMLNPMLVGIAVKHAISINKTRDVGNKLSLFR